MTPNEIRKNLMAEQWELYLDARYCIENHLDKMPKAKIAKSALEALAEHNQLLEEARQCLAAGCYKLHNKITAALKGVGE